MTPPTITTIDPVAPTRREISAKAVFDDRGEFQFAVPPLADPVNFTLKGDAVEACTVVVGPSALEQAWALTARSRLARRYLQIEQPADGQVACHLSAELGGLIFLVTAFGDTVEQAIEAAIAKAEARGEGLPLSAGHGGGR